MPTIRLSAQKPVSGITLSVDVKMDASQRRAMDLHFRQREKEGIQILDLQGPLIEGASEANLRGVIVTLAEAGTVNVILNFAGVTEIDADGAGVVVFCDARLVGSGGALKVALAVGLAGLLGYLGFRAPL
jgi:hypothetical protein